MATYDNDLRLKEIATGDESGTWGTSTNLNLELIGEALGYGTQDCFTTDADATTTVADGASDPARAMYFKVTSSATLTATRVLTIAPNTVSRVMFIENATTGSQSITISQGSGANVTIATGKTKVVYLDGAGSTAAVVDALALVDPGVTDTLAEVLVAGNTSGGTNIELSTTDKVQFRDTAIYLNSSVDGQLDIVADAEVQIAATTIDVNGTLAFDSLKGTGATTVTNILDEDNMASDSATALATQQSIKAYVDSQVASFDTLAEVLAQGNTSGGTGLTMSSGDDLTLTGAAYNAVWDSSDNALEFADNAKATFGAGSDLQIYHDATDSIINDNGTGSLKLQQGGSTKLEVTSTGIDVTGTIVGDGLTVDGLTVQNDSANITIENDASNRNQRLRRNASNSIILDKYNGTTTTNTAKFDENGDISFYNSTGVSQSLFWDASAESLGIGNTSPATALDVTGTVTADGLTVDGNAVVNNATNATLQLQATGGNAYQLRTDINDVFIYSATGARPLAKFAYVGDISFYEDTGTTAKLFWDASAESLGIGTASPSAPLDIVSSATGGTTIELDNTSTGGRNFTLYSSGSGNSFGAGNFALYDADAAAVRMLVDSSGNVGIGTSSPSQKLHLNAASGSVFAQISSGSNDMYLGYDSVSGLQTVQSDTGLFFATGASFTERLRIDSSGNVGIGVTPEAWDTYRALQIGNGAIVNYAPTHDMRMVSNAYYQTGWKYAESDAATLYLQDGDNGQHIFYSAAAGTADAAISWDEHMRIDSSGRVGIGGTPNTNWRNDLADQEVLQLGTEATFFSDGGVTTELWNNAYVDNADTFYNISTRGASRYQQYSGAHKWFTAASATAPANISTEINTTPKMILDVSGNLLVGTTTVNGTGITLGVGNYGYFSRSGDAALFVNRSTSDGDIVELRKADVKVGIIGTLNSALTIGTYDVGIQFNADSNAILPHNTTTGANVDASIDIGYSSGGTNRRFRDLYLSSGVYLGGTGASNHLDDYEEGTWTPTLNSASFTATGITVSMGRYVKVGNLVQATFTITFTGTSGNFTEGDAASIGGLPLTLSSSRAGAGSANASTGYQSNVRATWQTLAISAADDVFLGCHYVGGTVARSSAVSGEVVYEV